MKVYRSIEEVDFDLEDCPVVPESKRVLMTAPTFFDVQYVINPHMEGHIGNVDVEEATEQWRLLGEAYRSLGIEPSSLAGVEKQPDMVFCANQTLPYYNPRSGERGVVLSHMHAGERRDEVEHYAHYFESLGYHVHRLPDKLGDFEGMGDALWHPRRYLLWGGYGFRTSNATYDHIADALNVRVAALSLSDPDFYHLDTCLSMLDERSALYFPGAFDEPGLALLRHFFDRLIEAPEREARELFACNAHCPDGEHVLIQRGSDETVKRLRRAGFTPVELNTSEFMKSGGSVFCMKQMYW